MIEVARPERDRGDAGDAGERPRGRARRGPGRRPGPSETRDQILDAARALFAEKGYDATSLRSIARAAGVDPALVHHYFGNKEGVFTAAMRFPVDPGEFLPRIMATPRERLGEAMVRTFLTVWEDDARRAPILAMLRSAMTNERAAVAVREFLASALFGRVAEAGQIPRLRLNAAAGQLIGVMFLRYVLRVEPIASAGREELVALLAPVIQRYLDEPS
ncbi:TetR family transcriptional regulator [Actinomadura sp. NBRC 104425]|uniref:TetR/AcrR family transcriptional regulator n=1 Tax=Actinomadura sp. NBRC 104425 TaxID=3032204 RepID=UPI0024A0AE39|nr:TetR family transcriptional regulator [Actinomadura sp. NBRC 104425]GLZ15235.1 TetR family transcriptional regulator [Actinomadura sp. NBRC 104425]